MNTVTYMPIIVLISMIGTLLVSESYSETLEISVVAAALLSVFASFSNRRENSVR